MLNRQKKVTNEGGTDNRLTCDLSSALTPTAKFQPSAQIRSKPSADH
jgi:hypothetical protein